MSDADRRAGIIRLRITVAAFTQGRREGAHDDIAFPPTHASLALAVAAVELARDASRTLYRFDVRPAEEFAAGHIAGFRHYPGGQLVQETDMAAPVRGARILLADDLGARAAMTASWLAQMGWEVHVLDGGFDGPLERGESPAWPPIDPAHRYKRPYEGTDNAAAAMQAYLDWEFGLVAQLERDASHGFFVI